jgi:tetratricopeptide (TPR) repeat protein
VQTEALRILLGRILNNIGIAHLNEGRNNEALDEFRRALSVRQGLGYRVGEVVNLHNMGDTWLRIGDVARAYASFEQSRELARDCGWERGTVMNDVFLAYLRFAPSPGSVKLGDHGTVVV